MFLEYTLAVVGAEHTFRRQSSQAASYRTRQQITAVVVSLCGKESQPVTPKQARQANQRQNDRLDIQR
jgi:hypothetical protein